MQIEIKSYRNKPLLNGQVGKLVATAKTPEDAVILDIYYTAMSRNIPELHSLLFAMGKGLTDEEREAVVKIVQRIAPAYNAELDKHAVKVNK